MSKNRGNSSCQATASRDQREFMFDLVAPLMRCDSSVRSRYSYGLRGVGRMFSQISGKSERRFLIYVGTQLDSGSSKRLEKC